MELRKLGKSDLEVSKMAIGCWSFGGGDYWGAQDIKDVDEVVHSAIEDYGINIFDNAYGYPGSEEALGKVSAGVRHKMIICDKLVLTMDIARQEEQLAESLKNLHTDYIDIYMIHWPDKDKAYIIKTLEWMKGLRKKGIIRHIGVSNFGVEQLGWVKESGEEPVADQLVYNILTRAVEYAITPYCLENRIGIMAYMPIMQGILTGKYKNAREIPPQLTMSRHFSTSYHKENYEKETFEIVGMIVEMAKELDISAVQLSLAWVMVKKGISTAIAGCRNKKQLDQNVASISVKLDESVVNKIDEISWQLKEKLGDSPDIYYDRAASRIY